MAQWQKNEQITVEILGYNSEGQGVARVEGRVVFVAGTIRGEQWLVRLEKVTKSLAWGRGVQLLKASPERVQSDCPLAGRCGGCQFRHMTYAEELQAKHQRVLDALQRVGGCSVDLPPVLGAENPDRYRNKVQLPVAAQGNDVAIGYYRARSHAVLDAQDCMLQPLAVTRLRAAVKAWMEKFRILPYCELTKTGLVRHLYVRVNHRGESLCCLVINGDSLPHINELVDALIQTNTGLRGVVLNRNKADTNVILGAECQTLWGQDFLMEDLMGIEFRLSVPSFFQINRAQTQRLYEIALEFAALRGDETVFDLYCGIGTISLLMAKRAKQVIGAEIVPQAVADAEENAARNGFENARFLCADAAKAATQLAQEGIHPQVICVDPPRKGLGEEVPEILANLAPQRIVYVSCDPATLARDINKFSALGYEVIKARAVDLFPRTGHVETCVLLSHKNS